MRKPKIHQSEHRLALAWSQLALLDPDAEMSPEEAEKVLASYVDRDAALDRRDDVVRFIRFAEARAEAKRAEAAKLADPLLAEVAAIESGVERFKYAVVRLMERLGVDELLGKVYALRVKRSPGQTVIYDQSAVPDEFLVVKGDADLQALEVLREYLVRLAKDLDAETRRELSATALQVAARHIAEARARRTVVNKAAIKARWKEAGETQPIGEEDRRARAAAGYSEIDEVPTVPGAQREVTTKLVFTDR